MSVEMIIILYIIGIIISLIIFSIHNKYSKIKYSPGFIITFSLSSWVSVLIHMFMGIGEFINNSNFLKRLFNC